MLRPMLEAELERATGERVDELVFFRTEWQRGGAATGRARTARHDLVVKLPVNDAELRWFRRLGAEDPDERQPVARLIASGEHLGGFDLAWIALERLPRGPVLRDLNGSGIQRLAEASARFSLAAAAFEVDRDPTIEDWNALLHTAIDAVRDRRLDHRQVWNQLLKQVVRDVEPLATLWDHREPIEWIHGDLHPGNGLLRSAEPNAPIILIDLANVRAGHWLEDAIDLERLLWTRADLLKSGRPLRVIAEARRAVGLSLGPDWDRLARARRILLAATAPAFLRSEGSPSFLAACIGQLERNLREIGPLKGSRAASSGTPPADSRKRAAPKPESDPT